MNESHTGTSMTTTTPNISVSSYANGESFGNLIPTEEASFRNYIVVLNEKSGSANLPSLKNYMEERSRALGKNVVFLELNKEMDLGKELTTARDEQGTDVYIAAGGDGTLASVAHFARLHSKIFAAIPCGTANVFAKEHAIPSNPHEAAELALTGSRTAMVDVLDVSGKTYLCHISIGTYSWITLHTNAESKRKYGRIAYVANAIKLMMQDKIFHFEIVADGKRLLRRASTIMVTNAGSMGATSMRWGENIVSDDGIAEICIFKARTLKHYFALLFTFILRKPHHPLKEYVQVFREASVKGSKELPVRADGERIANGSFSFKIVHNALRVLVPESFHGTGKA